MLIDNDAVRGFRGEVSVTGGSSSSPSHVHGINQHLATVALITYADLRNTSVGHSELISGGGRVVERIRFRLLCARVSWRSRHNVVPCLRCVAGVDGHRPLSFANMDSLYLPIALALRVKQSVESVHPSVRPFVSTLF